MIRSAIFIINAVLLSVVAVMPAMAVADNAQDSFERCSFTAKNGVTVNYRELSPIKDALQSGERYPLVVFLHGSGERGSDNSRQLDNGGSLFADPNNRMLFPAYVLFPQCPDDCFWSYKSAPKEAGPKGLKAEKRELPLMVAVSELIDEYRNRPDVDPDRVYIVGLSMGGMAVYDMLCRHPQTYAAAVAICGAVDPDRLSAIKEVPIRIFHGRKDSVVPVIASEIIYNKLKDAGDDVELIEFPNTGHDSWNKAFAQSDFLSWLFARQRHDVPNAKNGALADLHQ